MVFFKIIPKEYFSDVYVSYSKSAFPGSCKMYFSDSVICISLISGPKFSKCPNGRHLSNLSHNAFSSWFHAFRWTLDLNEKISLISSNYKKFGFLRLYDILETSRAVWEPQTLSKFPKKLCGTSYYPFASQNGWGAQFWRTFQIMGHPTI